MDRLMVALGEHDMNQKSGSEQLVTMEKIILHPEYIIGDLGFHHDIALIKLSSHVTPDENIKVRYYFDIQKLCSMLAVYSDLFS